MHTILVMILKFAEVFPTAKSYHDMYDEYVVGVTSHTHCHETCNNMGGKYCRLCRRRIVRAVGWWYTGARSWFVWLICWCTHSYQAVLEPHWSCWVMIYGRSELIRLVDLLMYSQLSGGFGTTGQPNSTPIVEDAWLTNIAAAVYAYSTRCRTPRYYKHNDHSYRTPCLCTPILLCALHNKCRGKHSAHHASPL